VRREATGPAAPGWEVDYGGASCAAGKGVMGRSDVTARAKREARWRERAGVPSSRAGVLGVRWRLSSRGDGGAVGAGQPAQTGGRRGPGLGAPASCRLGVGGAGERRTGAREERRGGVGVDGRARQPTAGVWVVAGYRTHQSTTGPWVRNKRTGAGGQGRLEDGFRHTQIFSTHPNLTSWRWAPRSTRPRDQQPVARKG
jgi:hypothetical protein